MVETKFLSEMHETIIEKFAKGGNQNDHFFPRSLLGKDSIEISFSGLKNSRCKAGIQFSPHIGGKPSCSPMKPSPSPYFSPSPGHFILHRGPPRKRNTKKTKLPPLV